MQLDGRDLEDLDRAQLIEIIEAKSEGGIEIGFAGKGNARGLARRVRPRTLRTLKKYSSGSPEEQARNFVIEGDNLQAMTTLYRYRGHVDLILTDPPYNTGNDWRYNDRWEDDPNDIGLGDWVSGDDGARHTKWMRFMLPRLQMMKSMLKPGGALAICIDHRELFHLGQMLDELFGEENRVAIINWQKASAPRPDNAHVSTSTEYILVYAKDKERLKTEGLARGETSFSRYSNPDADPEGAWREGNLTARTHAAANDYAIQSPFTGKIHYPAGSGAWRHPKRNIKAWLEEWGGEYREVDIGDGRARALLTGAAPDEIENSTVETARSVLARGLWPFLWFGRDGLGRPRVKTYLARVRKGHVPVTYWAEEEYAYPEELDSTSWAYTESGRSSDGVNELTQVVGPGHDFNTVKPLKLFEKLIQIWCPPSGLVLDPFAGSGTTGHAVLSLNTETEASRRFALIEQGRPERGDSYARSLTADRLSRVIRGKWVDGSDTPLSGGFRFYTLHKKVDAEALLSMERHELADAIVGSHLDAGRRRRDPLVKIEGENHDYLIARNADGEGVFLVWGGLGSSSFDEELFETCAEEARAASLAPRYHVYARLNLYRTSNVVFYPIPDHILMDMGLDLRGEPFYEDGA